MTSLQMTRLMGGSFIIISLALGVPASPIFVNQWWLAFTAFIGLNFIQSAFTCWCLPEMIFRKLGAKEGC